MVEPRKQTSSDSTRVKFQSIFERIDPINRRTKIICAIKANSQREELGKLLDAGMNIASFNFCTGDQRVSARSLLMLCSNTANRLTCSVKLSSSVQARHVH